VIAFILTSALTPIAAWPVYILLLAVILSAELLSEMGIPYYLKRALLAVPFFFLRASVRRPPVER